MAVDRTRTGTGATTAFLLNPVRGGRIGGSRRTGGVFVSVVASAAAAALLSPLHSARAANGSDTWLGATDANFSTGSNWSPATNAPPISGDSLIFDTSSTTTLNNDLTSGTFNVAGITFNAAAPAYTINGNPF